MPIEKDKISYNLDLTKHLQKIKSREAKKKFKEDVGNFIINEIKRATKQEFSPVTGEKFEPLSKEYKKQKKKEFGNGRANLKAHGDMLDSIKIINKASGIEIKITDTLQKKKAYNHNVGDTVKRRPFLPDDSKQRGKFAKFDTDIIKGIEEFANDASEN